MDLNLAKLRSELYIDEGRRTRMYYDSVGVPTIGVGWNLESNELPDDVIDRLLDVSIERGIADLDAIQSRWVELDEDRQHVLLNMAFNLGRTRLAGFVRFWEAIADWLDYRAADALERAASEMLDSVWARQVGARAERLAARMRSGETLRA